MKHPRQSAVIPSTSWLFQGHRKERICIICHTVHRSFSATAVNIIWRLERMRYSAQTLQWDEHVTLLCWLTSATSVALLRTTRSPFIFSLLSLLWKNKSRLMRSPCWVSVYPSYQLLNGWTNLYETWYVYHGTWVHLNGVLHKSLPSVCVSICVFPYRC
jgi:hypothetical protein